MSKNPFDGIIGKRNAITKRQLKEVRKLYNQWAREVKAEAERLKYLHSSSSLARKRELTKLYYQLRNASKELSYKIGDTTIKGANEIKDVVVATNKRWLKSLGMSTASNDYILSRRANAAIIDILTGNTYNGIGLSQRIWNLTNIHEKDIYNIIAKGEMMGLPPDQIARQIQKYVNPQYRFLWNSRYVDPKTGNVMYYPVRGRKVDYNATRLVRTTIQHAYQNSLVALTRDNPLLKGYRWIAAGGHPCDLCLDRDGNIYTADSIPLDHPNGQCEIEPIIVDTLSDL